MSAGRICPLSYRYSPDVFRSAASASTNTLYVVGGLYGNEQALDAVLRLFDAERGRKHLIFNGDFNWFNVAPTAFLRVNTAVLSHDAIRGNVETELLPRAGDAEVGCGCAYPGWVDDGVVQRSNAIMQELAATAARSPGLQQQLASLPMWRRVDVGGYPVGIVHGDAESLAGWGFSQERLADDMHAPMVRQWFDAAGVRLFACSHTCLPVLHALHDSLGRLCMIANNGAAGMPNFSGAEIGLLTRISTTPYEGDSSCYGARLGDLYIDALPIEYDAQQWRAAFLAQWPPGSAAYESYWSRITGSISYTVDQAFTSQQAII